VKGGFRHLFQGVLQGQTQGIAAGQGADQGLQDFRAAEPLQISDEGQGAIRLALPAELLIWRDSHLDRDGDRFANETTDLTSDDRIETEVRKGGRQLLLIPDNGRQDGEVRHEPLPAVPDLSDGLPSIQWPLSQPWPIQHPLLRLGVMASGQGTNFEALLTSCREGPLDATVALLVVNNPGCGAQRRAERWGVPWELIDHRLHTQRRKLDEEILRAFLAARVDLVVMAGWMRIVSPVLIEAFAGRLLNIHPSLLPSFPGLDGVGQALAAGVSLTGCTAHLVSEQVDAGPILVQAAVPVLPSDDHASLSKRIHRQEHRILPLAVALAAQRLPATRPDQG